MKELDIRNTFIRTAALTVGGLTLYGAVAIEQTSASPASPGQLNPENTAFSTRGGLFLSEQLLTLPDFDEGSPQIDFPGQPCVAPVLWTRLLNSDGSLATGRRLRIFPTSNPDNDFVFTTGSSPTRFSVTGERNAKKWVNVRRSDQVFKVLYDATVLRFELIDARPTEAAILGEATVACEPCEPKVTEGRIEEVAPPPTATPTPRSIRPTATPTERPVRPPVQVPPVQVPRGEGEQPDENDQPVAISLVLPAEVIRNTYVFGGLKYE